MAEIITEMHIDEAFDFISYKLDFLKTYNDIEIPDYHVAQPDKVRHVEILFCNNYQSRHLQ